MLKVDKVLNDGRLLVTVEGELDTLSSPVFEAELEPFIKEADSVTFNFEKLEYISSAGLRVLLSVEQSMEEKGADRVRIVNLHEALRNVFIITGFADVLILE